MDVYDLDFDKKESASGLNSLFRQEGLNFVIERMENSSVERIYLL